MKKLLFGVLTLALLASCSGKAEYQVSGKFDDVADEDLCLMFLVKNFTRCDHTDTLHVAADGTFAFNNVDPAVYGQILITTFNPDGTASYSPYILLPVLPGEYVKISGTLAEPSYDGSKFYKQLNEYTALVQNISDEIQALAEDFRTRVAASPDSSEALMAEYQASVETYQKEYMSIAADFIKNNPDDNFAGYLAGSQFDETAYNEAIEVLSDKVKNGVMAPYLEYTANMIKQMSERKAAMGHVEEGDEAPDFTLKNLAGEDFTLSSLRGKYVMLDFWGSWCKWCIKGIPTLKEIYAAHSKKLEIVSVDCNDTEEAWKKAVEENEMPWIHVKNTEDNNPVDAKYGVEGYPTFVIIDPEGKVVKVFVGESEDFVPFMNNLLK